MATSRVDRAREVEKEAVICFCFVFKEMIKNSFL